MHLLVTCYYFGSQLFFKQLIHEKSKNEYIENISFTSMLSTLYTYVAMDIRSYDDRIRVIESYMGGGRRLVCPTRGPVGDGSGPEGQWGMGVDPSAASVPTPCWPEGWTNQSSIPVYVRFFFMPLPSKMHLLWEKMSTSRETLLMTSAWFWFLIFGAWHVFLRLARLKISLLLILHSCAHTRKSSTVMWPD